MRHLVRLGCSLMAAGPLVAGSMAMPAYAEPVFTVHDVSAYSEAYNSSLVACTTADNPTPVANNVPIAENGAPTSLPTNNSGTITRDSDPTDTISFATSATATGRVTSVGGNPGVIELTTIGNVQADTTKPTSTCVVTAYSGGYMYATFAVTQGGFMTFTTRASRHSYGGVHINDTASDQVLEINGTGVSFSGVTSVYLAPGTYAGYFEGDAYIVGSDKAVPSTPVSVSIRATFAVAGSQSKAVSGTGKTYLTFPAARSCATDSVDAVVTGKGKRAKQIRKVKLFVNGAKVRTLTTPKKGQLVQLPITDAADADVRAEVTLKPARPGRKPKTHEVTVGYVACS